LRDDRLALDCFGDFGRTWCETAEVDAERSILIDAAE
jgi:hypothetical protein